MNYPIDRFMGAHSLGAGVQTMGSSIGQSVSDGLYKGLTGQEKRRDLIDGGTLRFGQTFTEQGQNPQKADFSDMTKQAKIKGTDVANQKVQNIMNNRKKHLPSNNN